MSHLNDVIARVDATIEESVITHMNELLIELSDDAELTQARLLLSINVQQVLRNGLELLGVSAPESM